MTREVKRRAYDSPTRREQSAMTRQRIIDSARDLIVERGYRRTTVAAIAQSAGVNTDTVYEVVGRKPLVLRELIEQAISGTDHPVDAEQRAHVKAIQAEPDPAEKLALYARAVRETQERLAPLFLALRDASSTEPEAREIWLEISERRAANMRRLVEDVDRTGGLRPDLAHDDAADMLWATNSPELFLMLTTERAWSPSRFEHWLAETWNRLLLVTND